MPRRTITPIIPANEREYNVYHGNLALANIDAASSLGETVLNAYHDREPLGMGAEKVVYPHAERTSQAVAFYMKRWGENGKISTEELKRKYYAIKLMHLLLPDNIPDAHFVGSDPASMHLDMVTSQPLEDEEFGALYRDLKGKADNLGVFLDPKRSNFLLGDDGNLKYVDDFGLPDNPQSLEAEIMKIEDHATRNKAIRYADRAYMQPLPIADLGTHTE